MFTIDFYSLIVRLLPPFLRKPKMTAWLYRLIVPIVNLYAEFLYFRNDTLMRTSVNGQTIAFEWLLNQLFDPTNNGIHIETNSIGLGDRFVFSEVNAPAPNYVYSENDTTAHFALHSEQDYLTVTHFTVLVSTTLIYDNLMLTAVIDYYKLAGKKYTIQTY